MSAQGSPRVLAIGASQRAGSYNAQLAALAGRLLETHGLQVELPEYSSFNAPAFDDRAKAQQGDLPEGVQRFVRALERADGVLIAAPEYNWSYSGALKSLIDWVSCLSPCPLAGKYGILLSASPSRRGGMQGLLHLRVPLEGLGMHLHPAMLPVARAGEQMGETTLRDAALQAELEGLMADYAHRLRIWKANPCA